MLSSLTEAEQAAACFTLSFPTDCFLLRPIIYQGEHLPISPPAGLAVVSVRAERQPESARGCKAGQPRGHRGHRTASRAGEGCASLAACPTPATDVPGQRGPACAQLLHIWLHVVIPDERFWGLVCSFLRDLTESISLLQ